MCATRSDRWPSDDGDDSWDDVSDWDEDEDEDEDSDTVPCPSCGADVHEEAEHCPTCGDFIVHSTNPWRGKPWWWVILGLAGIGAVLWLSMP